MEGRRCCAVSERPRLGFPPAGSHGREPRGNTPLFDRVRRSPVGGCNTPSAAAGTPCGLQLAQRLGVKKAGIPRRRGHDTGRRGGRRSHRRSSHRGSFPADFAAALRASPPFRFPGASPCADMIRPADLSSFAAQDFPRWRSSGRFETPLQYSDQSATRIRSRHPRDLWIPDVKGRSSPL